MPNGSSPYRLAIEECGMDGEIGLGRCSASTVYAWARKMNEILESDKADWRVKALAKERAIKAVPYVPEGGPA